MLVLRAGQCCTRTVAVASATAVRQVPGRLAHWAAPAFSSNARLSAVSSRRWCSSGNSDGSSGTDQGTGEADTPLQSVSREQLRAHFVQSAVPMVGFGFMDNTVMIYAGSAIDATFGVTLGLSTMCAAACGQICSDVAGVSFGGVIEAAANKLGLPSPQFTNEQRELPVVKRIGVFGAVVGVFTGCSLGLTNLLFVDTEQARELVLATQDDPDDVGYTVTVSNTEKEGVTTVVVEGPARKGLVAAVTAKLSSADLAIEGVTSDQVPTGEFKHREFYVTKDGEQVPDDGLEDLGKKVLVGVRNPERYRRLSMELEEVKRENSSLQKKLADLQKRLEALLITVKRKVDPSVA